MSTLFLGRYQTGKKNLLLLHDIDLKKIVSGADADKIKSIARSETTCTKIQGSTNVVIPIWIFCSSNMNLNSFNFKHRNGGLFSQRFSSNVEMAGQKRRHEESLNAIRCRFVELFVKQAPRQDEDDLKNCDNFERDHCVLGIYSRILATVQQYDIKDFSSKIMTTYLLSGLIKFAQQYAVVMKDDPTPSIKNLVKKFQLEDFKFTGRLPNTDNRQSDADPSTSPQPSQRPDTRQDDAVQQQSTSQQRQSTPQPSECPDLGDFFSSFDFGDLFE